MSLWEVVVLAIGLSMDAFSVSITQAMYLTKEDIIKKGLLMALAFGVFQSLMPSIGYLLGSAFASYIERFDHWIAFGLLVYLGGNMIHESKSDEGKAQKELTFKNIIILAIATSIDALASGVTLAFLNADVWSSIALIGVITFIICTVAVFIGYFFKEKFHLNADIIGGIVLIILGTKILLDHLGII